MKKYLIDTSVWILALKRDASSSIKEKVKKLLKENFVGTFGMIKLELLGGVKSEKEFKRLRERMEAFYEIPATSELWEKAGEMSFKLKKKGITIPYTDILIATASLSENMILVHADIHFELIAKHFNLKTENFLPLLKNEK